MKRITKNAAKAASMAEMAASAVAMAVAVTNSINERKSTFSRKNCIQTSQIKQIYKNETTLFKMRHEISLTKINNKNEDGE